MYPQVFEAAKQVDQAFLAIFGLAAVVLVGVTACMLWFLYRYHHTRHPEAADIEGHVGAEIIWTVAPTLLVLGLFWIGWTSYMAMRGAPEGAMEVAVEARKWSWAFTYPNGKRSAVLMAPKDTPVKLNMTSRDVIHSFYVPAMRIKMDTVPGMTTHVWFKSDETGEFDILCAEYCGLKHANMLATLKVVEPEEFQAWLGEGGQAANRGKALLEEHGCTSCHSLDGSVLVGPSLKDIAGRPTTLVLPDGSEKQVDADADYLRRAILDPSAELVKGFDDMMPPGEGTVPRKDVEAMVSFLLGGRAEAPLPGRALAQEEGCLSCHSTDGSEIAGPSFKGLFGSRRKVEAGGADMEVTADEAYVRESILLPGAKIVDGYVDMMPPYDYLAGDKADQLVDFIKSLGDKP